MNLPDIAAFMNLLNEETAIGDTAAAALCAAPADERGEFFDAHPQWARVGVFEALLRYARAELDRNVAQALEITTFVIDHISQLEPPPGGELLLALLVGTAHKDHASALFRQGEHLPWALASAGRAVQAFTGRPSLVVDRAAARFVQSQIWHAMGYSNIAFAILDECEDVFAQHGAARPYVKTLSQRGYCLFDVADDQPAPQRRATLLLAYRTLRDAIAHAQRIRATREVARLLNNLGHCVAALGKRRGARAYFARALHQFTGLGMTGEVQRTLWGIAELEVQDGRVEEGVALAHRVYTELLDRGMPVDAGLVFLDITAKLDELRPECRLAKDACRHLGETMSLRPIPVNVRNAVTYLAARAGDSSAAELRHEMARVYDFFSRCKNDPTTNFETAA